MNRPPTKQASFTLSLACGPLAGPVLERVISLMVSRADLSVDRLSDALLLSDTIVANAPDAIVDGHIGIRGELGPGRVRLRVGPLKPHGATRMIEASRIPGAGDVLAQLADELGVEQDEHGEYLWLELLRRARSEDAT